MGVPVPLIQLIFLRVHYEVCGAREMVWGPRNLMLAAVEGERVQTIQVLSSPSSGESPLVIFVLGGGVVRSASYFLP